jgi:DNA primase
MITENSLNLVRDADLVKVIEHFVELKKSGSQYKGKSPFINERSPSFMVSPAKGIWKCFSSGNGGSDAISFVMEHEGLDFIGAVKEVAKLCNIYLEHEELTEEKKKRIELRDKFLLFNDKIAKEYQILLNQLKAKDPAKNYIYKRGFTTDDLIAFKLGYTPGNVVNKIAVNAARVDVAKETGLITMRQGASYDFFYNRIIFPVHNENGRVIGFGGRAFLPEETIKYLNSKESEIFDKSRVLYGLYQARKEMVKKGQAVLTEGYTDVIALHRNDVCNAVATLGTALTVHHAKKLRKYVTQVILFRDNDGLDDNGKVKGGVKAALRDVDTLLMEGLDVKVVIPEEGKDPDELCKEVDISLYINDKAQDAVLWKAKFLLNYYGDDKAAMARAYEEVIDMLCCVENEIIRNEYIKDVAGIFGQPIRTVKTSIKKLESKKASEAAKRSQRNGTSVEEMRGFPEGADFEEFQKKGFITLDNKFMVPAKGGEWRKASNFKMTPLFHVEGDKDTTRLFDIVNEQGDKALVDMESSLLLNFQQNQNRLLDYGVFVWDIDLSNNQFKLIMQQLIREFIKVKPFSYFGWQTKGFWAFANGIYKDGGFCSVNEYGLVNVEGLDKVDSDYYNNTPYYYSPAFNITNRHKEDNQDTYANDRSFIFKQSPVNFSRWAKQMVTVYDRKAYTGIGFVVSSLFRDLIMKRHGFFPHLFCTGEKGAGKSKFAESLACVFTYMQQPFDLNSGTMAAFGRRVDRGRNTATVMEEYHDKIDDRMFQSMKGAFDGRGRETGMLTNDNRTKVSNVHCSLIIVGQYLSTRDDNSLTSRSILQHFIKPQQQYTTRQTEEFDKLRSWQEQGLTSIVLEIVENRGLIEEHVNKRFTENVRKFKKDLEKFEYQERMLMNYCAIYTPIEILWKHFDWPFTLKEYYTECFNGIVDGSDLIVETEGLAEFWHTIEKLTERKVLKEDHHFSLDNVPSISIQGKKGSTEWLNAERDTILFILVNSVYQDYANEISRRDGVDVIGEGSLRGYFKSKRYYIGPIKSRRFTGTGHNSSCYAFNYTMMQNSGVLNLPIANNDSPFSDSDQGGSLNEEMFPEL